MSGKSIVWFKDVTKDDIPLVGGKGANLGEMTGANVPVPPGFIVTADAYFDFIDKSGLGVQIKRLLANLDTNDSKKLGITSSICGQAPSDYPDITRKLVTWGITSVSVNPDVIGSTREVVARTEAKLKA